MAWCKRSKLVFDTFRNLSPLQATSSGKLSGILDKWKLGYSNWPLRTDHQGASKKTPKIGFKIVVLSGIAFTIGFNRETVPYSERTQLVLVPRYLEKKLGESKIRKLKEEFKGELLPPEHPLTERVRLIAKNVNKSPLVEQYPEHLNWEVIVIDRPIVNAFCYDGKMVFFTGLLKHLESDAEIATIIGHEVAHDLARHTAEKLTRKPLLDCLELIMWFFVREFGVYLIDELVRWPFFSMLEREADDIGLLLMSSAGYDPCVVPTLYERLHWQIDRDAIDNCSRYPAANRRAELLIGTQVMKEAMHLYKGRISGCETGNQVLLEKNLAQ